MKRGLLLVLPFVMIPCAFAPDAKAFTLEIAPFGGYRVGGNFEVEEAAFSKVKMEPSETYGLSVGVEFDEKYQLEIMWSREEAELYGSGGTFTNKRHLFDVNVDQYHFNGLYLWGSVDDWVRPFLLFGLGATHFNPVSDQDSLLRFSFCLGGGVKLYFWKHLGIRLQGRWIPTYVSSDSAIFCSLPGSCVFVTSSEIVHQAEFTGGLILRF